MKNLFRRLRAAYRVLIDPAAFVHTADFAYLGSGKYGMRTFQYYGAADKLTRSHKIDHFGEIMTALQAAINEQTFDHIVDYHNSQQDGPIDRDKKRV